MLEIKYSKLSTPCGATVIGGIEDNICWFSFNDEGIKFKTFIDNYVNSIASNKMKQNFSRFQKHYPTIARMIRARNISIIEDNSAFLEATDLIQMYFTGKPVDFNTLKTIYLTGSEFEHNIWEALKTIPYGHTISYQQLASRVNKPSASRAAGNANGKNLIPLIIPCHRVIKTNKTIGGYSGGTGIKEKLLETENIKL